MKKRENWFAWASAGGVLCMGSVALSASYGPAGESVVPGDTRYFIALTLLHAIVYVAGPFVPAGRGAVAYLAIQSTLALCVGVFSGSPAALLGLSVIVTAEAVIRTVHRWRADVTIGSGLLLFLLGFLAIRGVSEVASALMALLVFGLLAYVANHARRVVTEHRLEALRAEIEGTHVLLADYSRQIEELTRDRERQRLARDLHDTLAQGLAGLALQLEAADSHLAREGIQEAREIILGAVDHARSSLHEARHAIHDLRVPARPLRDSLEKEMAKFREMAAIDCDAHFRVERDPPEHVRSELVLVVREALTNVARHARASRVDVECSADPEGLTLVIEDDGQGFGPDQTGRSGGYGVLGIRERVGRLGGTVSFESRKTVGTRVFVRVPTSRGAATNHGDRFGSSSSTTTWSYEPVCV